MQEQSKEQRERKQQSKKKESEHTNMEYSEYPMKEAVAPKDDQDET